jgi:diacylglycerol kinase
MSYQSLPGDSSHSGSHHDAPAPRGPSAPPIPPTSRGELVAFLNSFVYAWHGLMYAVRTQRNARVHGFLATIAIILGVLLRISPVEWAMVFIAITLVFIAEMFNTVAEACVDLVTREYNPLARIAKDVAAGAVLLNAMLSVVIGALVCIPHLWPLAQKLLLRL